MSRNYKSIAEPKTLNGNVTNIATQITLNNITGLPSPPYVLVINPDTASEEAVLVTTNQDGVTAPTLKVERAIETGATAKTHTDQDVVRHMIVGSDLQLAHNHIDLTEAHGATGAVVGTTNSQTLENKRLTTPKINENVTLTATSTELNVLDGITASTAELNIMDGVTSTTAELNILDGVTSSTAELNILDGVTSSAAELNILDGATLSTAELNYVDGVTSAIQTQINNIASVPTGVINPYAGPITNPPAPPTGWLLCDGAAVSRSTYATLFGIVGTTYGVGDNSTTFNLPNLKGRVPVGLDSSQSEFDTLGETGGAKTVTLTQGQIPSFNHEIQMSAGGGDGTTYVRGSSGGYSTSLYYSHGSGEAHPNLQPYIVVNYIIKY
jgi:microcystin-dependent protein